MKIPYVTDQQLDKIVEAARSPVCVIVTEAGHDESLRCLSLMNMAADMWAHKVIFLVLWWDENPHRASLMGVGIVPSISVFKEGKEISCRGGLPLACDVHDLLERVAGKPNSGRGV